MKGAVSGLPSGSRLLIFNKAEAQIPDTDLLLESPPDRGQNLRQDDIDGRPGLPVCGPHTVSAACHIDGRPAVHVLIYHSSYHISYILRTHAHAHMLHTHSPVNAGSC